MSMEVAEDRLLAGRTLYAAGNFLGAERMLGQALAADPEMAHAHALLALAFYRQNKGRPALDAANAAIALSPDSFGFRAKALALRQLGQKAESLKAAQAAVASDPIDQRAILMLAIVLEDMKKLKEAESVLRRGVAIGHDQIGLRADLGSFLLRRNRWAEAEAEAAALDPASDDESALLLRGDIALRRGRTNEAREFGLWILSNDATSAAGLRLLNQVKASESRMLGFWWRYTLFMTSRRRMFRWFVVVPVTVVLFFAVPWLMVPFLVYLHICERMFLRMVRQERGAVTLKESF